MAEEDGEKGGRFSRPDNREGRETNLGEEDGSGHVSGM